MSDTPTDGDKSNKLLYCSFCGKSQHEVRKLIAGPSVYICDECVELCNDIIREEIKDIAPKHNASDKLPVPKEIRKISWLCRDMFSHVYRDLSRIPDVLHCQTSAPSNFS